MHGDLHRFSMQICPCRSPWGRSCTVTMPSEADAVVEDGVDLKYIAEVAKINATNAAERLWEADEHYQVSRNVKGAVSAGAEGFRTRAASINSRYKVTDRAASAWGGLKTWWNERGNHDDEGDNQSDNFQDVHESCGIREDESVTRGASEGATVPHASPEPKPAV